MHRPVVAATLLGVSQLLRRRHQHLFDQRHSGLVRQFFVARLRPFEQFEHWQQCLATSGQHPFDQRSLVAMHDLQSGLCLRMLPVGFLADGFRLASWIL